MRVPSLGLGVRQENWETLGMCLSCLSWFDVSSSQLAPCHTQVLVCVVKFISAVGLGF